MKSFAPLLGTLLSSTVFASPLQVDVSLHIDTQDAVTHGVKGSPICQLAKSTSTSALPKVTFGYEVHQASPGKEGQTYYAFENIPYARQPVGDLRFKAAKGYTGNDYVENPPLNDGSKTVVCPQEQVGWFGWAGNWSTELFNPKLPHDSKFDKPYEPKDYPSLPKPIANQSEECLVLDVFVPKRVFDNEDVGLRGVIVSFHGGGFIFGSKTIFGSPEGILKTAGEKGVDDDVLIVSVNYRLGAFGWLAGEEFTEAGGFENAGLSDQNAALEWVYEHINLFGGDPYSITVLGESAGASSILHHLTAYGVDRSYKKPPRFQKAILQSPAFFPQVSPRQMNDTYRAFLKAAGVKNFAELQSADTDVLIKANSKTVYYSPYGTFTYGPVVSSKRDTQTYVQYPPSLKILIGSWFSQVQLMVANNRREGALFTPPWLRNEEALANYIRQIYPAMTKDTFDEFAQLYPVPQTKKNLVGKDEDTTERERFLYAAAAFGDLGVDCSIWQFKEKAPRSSTYQYFYRLYPGFHGQDVGATWYPEAGEGLTTLNPKEQSERLQRWLTCFAKDYNGNPNCAKKDDDKDFKTVEDGAMWIGSGVPVLDKDGNLKDDTFYGMSKLPGGVPSAEVCQFWTSAPYWEPDPDAARALIVQRGWANEL